MLNHIHFVLQDILQSLESHQTQIEEAISQGKDLIQKDGSLGLVQTNVARLEALSNEVFKDCNLRQEELETALNNWTRYNAALEGFKEVLANGEVEVTRRKALNVTGIEVVNEQEQEIQVCEILINIILPMKHILSPRSKSNLKNCAWNFLLPFRSSTTCASLLFQYF